MAKKSETPQFPKSLGAAADLWWDLRSQRLAADKAAAALKEREQAVEAYLINSIDADSTGVAGKAVAVRRIETETPMIEDWEKLTSYIKRKGAFHLLQHRLSVSSVNEVLEDGKPIPGVSTFVKVKLGYSQIK